jgi:hypothetical protein
MAMIGLHASSQRQMAPQMSYRCGLKMGFYDVLFLHRRSSASVLPSSVGIRYFNSELIFQVDGGSGRCGCNLGNQLKIIIFFVRE